MYIPNEVNALIAAAQDAKHCLSVVCDESLKGSIERTIASIEATLENVKKFYEPLPTDLSWMDAFLFDVPKQKEEPKTAFYQKCKDAFIDDRERSHNVWRQAHGFEAAY